MSDMLWVQGWYQSEEGVQYLDFLTVSEYLDIMDKLPKDTHVRRLKIQINSSPRGS